MDNFEHWLGAYGLNPMFVGFIAWVVLVEIPLVFVLRAQIKRTRQAALAHLERFFPSVWNFNPSIDIVALSRAEWLEASGFSPRSTLEYKYGWDKAKIVVLLVGAIAVATNNYWVLVLLPIALTSVVQGHLAAEQAVAQKIFDLKEQPWITRNRWLTQSSTSMQFDPLPLDFPNNPLHSRDVVGPDSAFHHMER